MSLVPFSKGSFKNVSTGLLVLKNSHSTLLMEYVISNNNSWRSCKFSVLRVLKRLISWARVIFYRNVTRHRVSLFYRRRKRNKGEVCWQTRVMFVSRDNQRRDVLRRLFCCVTTSYFPVSDSPTSSPLDSQLCTKLWHTLLRFWKDYPFFVFLTLHIPVSIAGRSQQFSRQRDNVAKPKNCRWSRCR